MKHSAMFALALRWGLALILLWVLVMVPVEAGLHRPAEGGVGFALERYAPTYPLAAAPTMQWNTFLGGSSSDWSNGVALDGSGNVHVVGRSYTTWGLPVNAYAGGSDAYVAKLDTDGIRQWNTFLGGSNDDWGNGVALDGSGNVYVVGDSDATWGAPINTFAGSNDAFVAKLNSNGVLQWMTFLGGSAADGGRGIALDKSGNVYVVGTSAATWGSPINPHPGGWGAPFVAKLNNSGALQWNTFWGAAGLDSGKGISVDGNGDVYVVGECYDTWGSPVNAYAGGTDACVAKLDTNGIRQWNTFLGSGDSDSGGGIAVDGRGDVYVVGDSSATWGAPINPHGGGSGHDAFVARLSGSDGLRQWNTFMGFSKPSDGSGIAVDGIGNVYAVGDSQDTGSGVFSAFLAKLDSGGSREWNIFMGGTYSSDFGSGVVPNGSDVYVVGDSKASWGAPINGHAGGLNDTFAAKLEVPAQANVAIAKSVQPNMTAPGGTITYALAFSNRGYLTATGVLISDPVPVALTDVSYTRSGAVITPTGSISYTWEVQDLAPGAGGVITITGIVSPGLEPGVVLVNTATITGATVDSNPNNDSSSVGVMVPSCVVFLPLVIKDY